MVTSLTGGGFVKVIELTSSTVSLKDFNLTVTADGMNQAMGILALPGSSLSLSDVTVNIQATPSVSFIDGIVAQCPITADGLNVNVSGATQSTGMSLNYGFSLLKNIDLTALGVTYSYGLMIGYNGLGPVGAKVYGSIIRGGTYSLFVNNNGAYPANGTTGQASGTQLEGSIYNWAGGTLNLVNCFDANFNPILNQ